MSDISTSESEPMAPKDFDFKVPVIPPAKKMPSVDQLDPSFRGINEDVPQALKDPVEVQKLLLTEQMKSAEARSSFDFLMEEYQNVKTRLSAQNSPETVSRKTSKQSTKNNQADEIRRIQAELDATKAQLNDIQMTSTKRVLPGDEDPQGLHIPEMCPAELEMVRATVIHENKHKYNLEKVGSLEEEIEKYRSLYNETRSRLTIINADFEQAKMERFEEVDALKFEANMRVKDAEKDRDSAKAQLLEIRRHANSQVDGFRREIVVLNEKLSSYKTENTTLEESRLKSLKEVDSTILEARKTAMDAQNQAKINELEIERLNNLIDSREKEFSKLRVELKDTKASLEVQRREHKTLQRELKEQELKFENDKELIKAEYTKQINDGRLEIEKFRVAWKKANSQLDTTRKNAEKRAGLAELAEKSANERIEEIKRDQWAIVEQIRSEKRETDSQLQKEIENCNRLRNELDMSKDEMKNNNSEAERMKAKFEKQLMSLRDEKAKIQQSLSEARIRNEQIEELKKTIEIDQKEKNELGRQLTERDGNSKELTLEKDALKTEITKLRQELGLSLEESKRSREEDRISFLEEKNRLNQRISQLELKNQSVSDQLAKSISDFDAARNKLQKKVRNLTEERLKISAEKDRSNAELELLKRTGGVPKEEHDRLKKRLQRMQGRMTNFAQAINTHEESFSGSPHWMSPRKARSKESVLTMDGVENIPAELTIINRRLDQMELDHKTHEEVFKSRMQ